MAVTLSLFAGAGAQFLDNNGVMLSGGLVYTYAAGTTTPLAAYTSNTGDTALANPIVLDASGRVPTGQIWLTYGQGYKFTVKTSTGTLIGTYDNIPSAALPPLVNDAVSIAYEQGASVTAGNFIIGQTYLITFIGSTNFQSVGAVSNTVGIYFTATGVGSGTGTAEISRTVEAKLRETVSVMDFGAIGDGVADDTAAIQAAINALLNIGGELYFPKGEYKITSSLNWISTVNSGLPGIFFVGEGGTGGPNGAQTTVLKSYIANGPLFQIQGTKTQSTGGFGNRFFNGGGISNIFIDGSNATGTSQAIRVNGWQYAEIDNVTIQNFPGDGVTQYTDAGYPNGDYSSSTINFKNCWILDNGGNGINQTGFVGAWSWQFNKVLFGWNGIGAVITSSGNSFIDCSFVGSGFSLAGAIRTGGIHIQAGTSTGSINRLKIIGCEFDYARLKHVSLDYIQTSSITESRFIFNDRNSTGTMTPLIGVDMASASAASNIQSILLDRCNIRVDTIGTLTGFKLSNISNIQSIEIKDMVWSDNTFGAATITRYSGFTASNGNLRFGLRVLENGAYVIPGKPAPYVVMTTVAGQTINTASFDNIIFGTQEAINAQIYPAGITAGIIYNTSTGVFTAPQTGLYEISTQLNFTGMTNADTVRTQISTTSGGTISFDGLGATPSSGTFGFAIPTTRVFCATGETIQVSARMAGTARALSTTASYASRLCIRMVS